MEEMKELLEEMTTWEKDAEIIYNLTKKHFPKKKIEKGGKKENLTPEEIMKEVIKEEEKKFRFMIGKGKKDTEKKTYLEIWKEITRIIKEKRIQKKQEKGEEIWKYKDEEGQIKEEKEKNIKIIITGEDTRKKYVKKVEEKKINLKERREELKQHIEDHEIQKLEEEIERILAEEREETRVKKMWDLIKKLKGKGKQK